MPFWKRNNLGKTKILLCAQKRTKHNVIKRFVRFLSLCRPKPICKEWKKREERWKQNRSESLQLDEPTHPSPNQNRLLQAKWVNVYYRAAWSCFVGLFHKSLSTVETFFNVYQPHLCVKNMTSGIVKIKKTIPTHILCYKLRQLGSFVPILSCPLKNGLFL